MPAMAHSLHTSSPMATNADIGNHTAMALPPSVCAAVACQTARHTSQLHRMPRPNACKRRQPHAISPCSSWAVNGPFEMVPRSRSQEALSGCTKVLVRRSACILCDTGPRCQCRHLCLRSLALEMPQGKDQGKDAARPACKTKHQSDSMQGIFCRPGDTSANECDVLYVAMLMAPSGAAAKMPLMYARPTSIKAPARLPVRHILRKSAIFHHAGCINTIVQAATGRLCTSHT